MTRTKGLSACLYLTLYPLTRPGFTNGSVHFTRSPYCVFDIDGFVGLLDGGSLRMNKKERNNIQKRNQCMEVFAKKKTDGLIQNDDHGQGSRWLVGVLFCKNIEIHQNYTFNKFSDLLNFE